VRNRGERQSQEGGSGEIVKAAAPERYEKESDEK